MRPGQFRIRSYIAVGVVICSAGGLVLAGSLISQARSLDADARLADGRSAVTRDVGHLATLVQQWLVTVDLVAGHQGSYLWEGAQDQADEIDQLLAGLANSDLVRRVGGNIAGLRQSTADAQAAVVELAFLDPSSDLDESRALIARIDVPTTQLVVGIEELNETVELEQKLTAARVATRRSQFLPLASAMSVAYVLLVVGVWRWSVVTLVRPLGRLTREALEHGPFGSEDQRVPKEIVLLNQSFHRFARSLESEKTALAASEAQSRDEAARSHAIMEAAPSAILVVDDAGRVLTHNETTRTMLEIDEAALDDADAASFFHGEILADGRREIEGQRTSGERFPLELATARFAYGGGTAFALVGHDRTEHRRLEAELRQSQKQESLGQLAAGLAHELNTPIQFVGDCIHFYQDAFSDLAHLIGLYRSRSETTGDTSAEEIRQFETEIDLPFLLSEIPAAGERTLEGLKSATDLIRATQELVHPAGGTGVHCDVGEAVHSATILARHRFEAAADLELDLVPTPPIHCGHGELVQVVVNLLSNAADAISSSRAESERGKLRISAAPEGDAVCIRIQDDGPGIPETIQERIFDPFFTTKDVGGGTGQGLSIARSIIHDRYGGTLTCSSEPGVGTTFEIRLALAE